MWQDQVTYLKSSYFPIERDSDNKLTRYSFCVFTPSDTFDELLSRVPYMWPILKTLNSLMKPNVHRSFFKTVHLNLTRILLLTSWNISLSDNRIPTFSKTREDYRRKWWCVPLSLHIKCKGNDVPRVFLLTYHFPLKVWGWLQLYPYTNESW